MQTALTISEGINKDYLADLNPAQIEAVMHDKGPLLAISGAGSGKTRTIVARVARLVDAGVLPEKILLLTFTRKAASEMLERAAAYSGGRCVNVHGGTFHSFASKLLRRHAEAVGHTPSFLVYDRSETNAMLGAIRSKLVDTKRTERFPKRETLSEMYSRAINCDEDLGRLIETIYPQFMHVKDDIFEIWQLYTREKQAKNVLDFDDLLVKCVQLLKGNPGICSQVSKSYQFILVDEYQDTNHLQSKLLYLLASEHQNMMVVGDDAQSIYGFRGGRVRNILDFPMYFPGTKILKLEMNYRSVQPILDFSNLVIARAVERFPKNLFTTRVVGEKPTLVKVRDDEEQSKYVVARIQSLIGGGISASQIAVLYRSDYLSRGIEVGLMRAKIPFKKYGGEKIASAAHVKDICSYLRVAVNPLDTVALARLVEILPGVGKKKSAFIVARVENALDPVSVLLDELCALKKSEHGRKIAEFIIETRRGGQIPQRVLQSAYQHYISLIQDLYDDFDWRLEDLSQLLEMAGRYDKIDEFLGDISLDPPQDADEMAGISSGDILTLSTIHSAKGLEWQHVFVIWASEGRVPSSRADTEEQIEEERRLFYVASTRARDGLFIIAPGTIYDRASGRTFETCPTRFIDQSDNSIRIEELGSDV